MTPSRSHPSQQEWTHWIEDPASATDPAALQQHLAKCTVCRRMVDTLRDVLKARRVSRWEAPPPGLVDRALKRPVEPAPPVPSRPRRLEWEPLDVRGGALGTAGAARLSSRVFDEGEVGIVAVPPAGDGVWQIRGKVWIRGEDPGELRVTLVHEDHVIATTTTRSGADFELEEAVGPGWTLEIHLPSGRTLTFEEPVP